MIALQPSIAIESKGARLAADLQVPLHCAGLVVFAHGGAGARLNPRDQKTAACLRKAGLATLLVDLLTREESRIDDLTREYRYDIALLAERVVAACRYAKRHSKTASLPIGLFGASTGAAAAFVAAAREPGMAALVSFGGRPDLASHALARVQTPSLLVVGGADVPQILQWNREAVEQLRGPRRLEIVPGAGPLFEETGALDRAIALSRDWLIEHLR